MFPHRNEAMEGSLVAIRDNNELLFIISNDFGNFKIYSGEYECRDYLTDFGLTAVLIKETYDILERDEEREINTYFLEA